MRAPDDLAALLLAVAAELGAEPAVAEGGAVELRAGGAPVATAQASALEARVGQDIAAAALRTPDTAASRRGPEWIRFTPDELDGHTRDRARAWISVAWQRATAARN